MNKFLFIVLIMLAISVSCTVDGAFAQGTSSTWNTLAEKMKVAYPPQYVYTVAEHKEYTKRKKAIYDELDGMRNKNENKFLSELLKQSSDVQSFVCEYLLNRNDKLAVPTLIYIYNSLNDSKSYFGTKEVIVGTVAHLSGVESRGFFIQASKDKQDITARRAAIEALAHLPYDRETVTRLSEALMTDGDPAVRQSAARALGNFPSDMWAKVWLERALSEEQGVLQAIKLSLQKMKDNK